MEVSRKRFIHQLVSILIRRMSKVDVFDRRISDCEFLRLSIVELLADTQLLRSTAPHRNRFVLLTPSWSESNQEQAVPERLLLGSGDEDHCQPCRS